MQQSQTKMRIRKNGFTLLEVMVAIAILAMASSVIGWKMHGAVCKKRFQSQTERLQDRFIVTQRLAIAMQADWKGVLRKETDGWVLEISCEEGKGRAFSPLHIRCMEILFEGKPVDELTFDFFTSGEVRPNGLFSFIHPLDKIEWRCSERDEGKKLGPRHPNATLKGVGV